MICKLQNCRMQQSYICAIFIILNLWWSLSRWWRNFRNILIVSTTWHFWLCKIVFWRRQKFHMGIWCSTPLRRAKLMRIRKIIISLVENVSMFLNISTLNSFSTNNSVDIVVHSLLQILRDVIDFKFLFITIFL